MLIKITNKCSLGCTHCMEDSTVQGGHMTEDTFRKALDFTARAERLARNHGCPTMVLLTGGECTEHPDILRFLELVEETGLCLTLLTNGHWLKDPALREAILRPGRHLFIQLTYDPRFYPTPPPEWDDPRIHRVPTLTQLLPLGRAGRKKNLTKLGVPAQKVPGSFNFRSAVRGTRSFEEAVAILRVRAMAGKSGHCTPSITHEGDVLAGESRQCWKVGTVDSTFEELTKNTLAMGSCNRCGLEDNLGADHKRAIGLTTLYY